MVEAQVADLAEDQIQAVLLSIQELFYQTSSFKDGENAGKLDMLQFEEGNYFTDS